MNSGLHKPISHDNEWNIYHALNQGDAHKDETPELAKKYDIKNRFEPMIRLDL